MESQILGEAIGLGALGRLMGLESGLQDLSDGEGQARHQIIVRREEDADVEARIGLGIGGRILLCRGCLHGFQRRRDRGQILDTRALGGQPCRRGLGDLAEFDEVMHEAVAESIGEIPSRDLGIEVIPLLLAADPRAHPLPGLHQPLGGQDLQGLAQRRPADAEFGDQLGLARQQAAGGIAALDDALADAADHPTMDAAHAIGRTTAGCLPKAWHD